MSQVVHIMYGSQTFKRASAKVHLFEMDCNGTDKRKFLRNVTNRASKGSSFNASLTSKEDCGLWFSYNLLLEEGVVIAINSSTSVRGSVRAEGILLLAIREDAPLITVSVDVCPRDKDARFDTIRVFNGRADVIDVNDAHEYNISYSKPIISRFFADEEIEEIYSIKELQKGTRKPKSITVPVGEGRTRKVRLPKVPRRRLRLNKH